MSSSPTGEYLYRSNATRIPAQRRLASPPRIYRKKITLTDREILHNQYRILQLLDPDNSIHGQRADALYRGFTREYSWIESFPEDTPKVVCDEVVSILCLYRIIDTSFRYIANRNAALDPEFAGFNSSEEPQHYRYARFLCHKHANAPETAFTYDGIQWGDDFVDCGGPTDLMKIGRLKEPCPDNRTATLPAYREMLEAFKQMSYRNSMDEKKFGGEMLISLDQAKELLALAPPRVR